MINGRRFSKLEETTETLRREVDALRYDVEDLKARVQRVLWRIQKTNAGATAPTDTGADGQVITVEGAPIQAPATSSVDPVSARLLARRSRRGPTRDPEEA